jgi:hypothetical protein
LQQLATGFLRRHSSLDNLGLTGSAVLIALALQVADLCVDVKRMSCVTDQYVTRARNVAVAQYASIKSALERTLGPQGWSVSQRSFIAGARSLNEQDLHDNLAYF